MMNDSFARLGATMVRYRWAVLVIWLLLIPVAGGLGASKASSVLKGGGFFRAGSESDQVTAVLAREFNAADSNNALIVFHSATQTVDDAAFQGGVNDAATRIKELGNVQAITNYYETHDSRLVSADKHTAMLIVSLPGDENDASEVVPALRAALEPVTLAHEVAGAPAVNHDLEATINEDLHRAEYVTIPIVVILLLLVFRTVISAAIPMLLGACAVVTAIAIIYVIGRQTTISIFALNTASMLGLGLGIDFSLIVVSRYREEVAAGHDPQSAVALTMATAGRSITYSGLTVMIGMLVLTLMLDIRLVRSMSLSILLVAFTALVAGLTLLPAVLGILGRRIEWLPILPKRQPSQPGQSGFWYRLSHAIMRRPWIWLGVSVALLLALAIPVKDMKLYGANVHVIPADTGAVRGFDTLSRAFGANRLSPIQVVVQTGQQDGVWQPQTLEALAQLQDAMRADPRVADVTSLFSLTPDVPRDQVGTITPQRFAADPALQGAVTQYVNTGNGSDTAVFTVIAKTDQFSADHQQFVRDLRDTIIPGIGGLRDDNAKVGGLAATFIDLQDGIYSRFPLIIATVLGLTFLLLMMFFQSLFLPLKAILMNLLSILATYGALVLIFQRGLGLGVYGVAPLGALSVVTPVILFVILFGLSTDYEVFMLSRVREFYHETGNNEEAVATGLESTARVITAAGLILIGTFASFSLGRVVSLKETGLGLAIGVLIDSTIVRIIMVPATMRLAGKANWYMPAWLKKIVPELREGPAPVPARTPVAGPFPGIPLATVPQLSVQGHDRFELPRGPMIGGLLPLGGGLGADLITLPRGATFRIGRDREAELWLYGADISRRHARIDYAREFNSFIITDLQSSNGIYLNGKRIDSPTILHDGDRLDIGSTGQVCFTFYTRPDLGDGTRAAVATRPLHNGPGPT
jgi:RND superfamily putative drug exporter